MLDAGCLILDDRNGGRMTKFKRPTKNIEHPTFNKRQRTEDKIQTFIKEHWTFNIQKNGDG